MPIIFNPKKINGLFYIPSGATKSESAAFSYSQSSYRLDESNPTPTITGDSGGTFTATPEGLSINSSTGEITLSSSVINNYTVTYTLPSGTFENRSLGITAAAFTNTNSFEFDGVNDYFNVNTISLGTVQTVSYWIKTQNNPSFAQLCPLGDSTSGLSDMLIYMNHNDFYYRVGGTNVAWTGALSGTVGSWTHCAVVRNGASVTLYVNGSSVSTQTLTGGDVSASVQVDTIGASAASTAAFYLKGDMDEVAVWNSALTSGNISSIYGSGTPSDLSTLNPLAWYRCGD